MQQCEMKTCLPATNLLGPLASPPLLPLDAPCILHHTKLKQKRRKHGEAPNYIHMPTTTRPPLATATWSGRRTRLWGDAGSGRATFQERNGNKTRTANNCSYITLILSLRLFSLYICLFALQLRLAVIRRLFLFASRCLSQRARNAVESFYRFPLQRRAFGTLSFRAVHVPPLRATRRPVFANRTEAHVHTYLCTYIYTLHDSVSVLWTPFGWHVADLEPRKCTVWACECVRCSAKSNSETCHIRQTNIITRQQTERQHSSRSKEGNKGKGNANRFPLPTTTIRTPTTATTRRCGATLSGLLYFKFTFNDFSSCGGVGGKSAGGRGDKATARQKSKWWTERKQHAALVTKTQRILMRLGRC